MTINPQFEVCSASTFLFEGHCLMECPFHTFSMAQPLPQQDALKLNLNVSTLSKTVEQSEDLQALDGSNETPNTLHTCNMCDDSCYTCYGPLSSQCSSCYAGSQLRKQAQRNENYCFVLSERSSGQYAGNGDTMSKNHENGATVSDNLRSITGVAKLILFLVPSLIFSLLLVLLILQCYLKPKTIKTTTIGVSYKRNNYDRVSLFPYKNEKINEEEKLFLAPNEEIAQDLKTHEQKKQEITMHIEDSECDEL